MQLTNQTILVTSNEPWGDIWYSKQNYAFELSRSNQVIFINPPRKWTPLNLLVNKIQHTKVNDSLSTIDYGNFFPVRWNLLNRFNNLLVSNKIRKYLKRKDITSDILWAFDPTRLYDHKIIGSKLGIYHCVDYYYFQYYGEAQLCNNSDLLFATSKVFLDAFNEFKAPKHVIPHGISLDEFEIDKEREEILNIDIEGFGLYIGVIDHRMDFEMYEMVIKRFPDQVFMFVGPIRLTDNDAAKRIFEDKLYPNVRIEGPKHFKDLKYYIAKSMFCMSFMDMTYHANTVHHHKTLVYLAQGKPIFSFRFEEYKKNDHIMYLDNEKEGLSNKLARFLDHGEEMELTLDRINYAKTYTFSNILDQASQVIASYSKQKNN